MFIRRWLFSYAICYGLFLVVMALAVHWLTLDYPTDFWPVFRAEALGGVLVAALINHGFWTLHK